jgi:biopolymer transport protein ExbB
MHQSNQKNKWGNTLKVFVAFFLLILLAPTSFLSADVVEYERRLEEAIKQAESELQAEKTRIQKEQQIWQEELRKTRAECKNLSDEMVECKISIARKQVALRQTRKQRETLWVELTKFQEDLSHLKSICSDAAMELSELMEILPVSEHRKTQRQQLSDLKGALAKDRLESAIELMFKLVKLLLHESRTTAIYTEEIIDPQGRHQIAQLLRIGQNVFAYHIPNTSRTAIAISDPYQQGGFRWYENLSNRMQRAIVDAIKQSQNREGMHLLPMDVAGTMTTAASISSKSLLSRIRSGGVVMFPLAIVAVLLAVLISERFYILLSESRHSLQFCENIIDMCSKSDFEKAERLANKRKGIVSRTLMVCLANRNNPPDVLDDAVQEAFLHELPKLERFLPSIRMLSSVAPILGLLGTVTGIIATFDMITVVGGGKPRLLAGGISEALITTATGLIIAIPGLLAHSFLSSKIEVLIADTERFSATLSNLIKHRRQLTLTEQNDRSNTGGATH